MKKPFNTALLLVVTAYAMSCGTGLQPAPGRTGARPDIPLNRYGLAVVGDLSTHKRLVALDTDKRLVDLQQFVPDLSIDVRYATPDNFMKKRLYAIPRAYLRYPAAVALKNVQRELAGQNLGLRVWDGYRPYRVTEEMWEPIRNPDYVADPAKGSRHNRGAAVDVTLIDLTSGAELSMPTAYDDFTRRAAHDFSELSAEMIANRAKLREVMMRHGFEPLPSEWWHYDFSGWQRFEILDLDLAELSTEND